MSTTCSSTLHGHTQWLLSLGNRSFLWIGRYTHAWTHSGKSWPQQRVSKALLVVTSTTTTISCIHALAGSGRDLKTNVTVTLSSQSNIRTAGMHWWTPGQPSRMPRVPRVWGHVPGVSPFLYASLPPATFSPVRLLLYVMMIEHGQSLPYGTTPNQCRHEWRVSSQQIRGTPLSHMVGIRERDHVIVETAWKVFYANKPNVLPAP